MIDPMISLSITPVDNTNDFAVQLDVSDEYASLGGRTVVRVSGGQTDSLVHAISNIIFALIRDGEKPFNV